MARIPDVMDFGQRPLPQGSGRIVSDQSGQIIGQALEGVGQQLQQVVEREDKFSYAQARAGVLTADIALRAELEKDPDWQTYDKRYREGMNKALGEAQQSIRSPRDRQVFDLEAKVDLERGAVEVGKLARGREVDSGIAELDLTLTTLREVGLQATDEATRKAVLDTMNDKIQGAVDRLYLKADDAQALRTKVAEDYAIGYIETLDAAQKIEYLSKSKGEGSIADYIPSDKRAVMLEQAKKEGMEVQARALAQDREDSIMKQHAGDPAGALAEARRLPPNATPVQRLARDRLEESISQRFAQDRAARNEIDTALYEKVSHVIGGGGTPDPADWVALGVDQQASLNDAKRRMSARVEPETDTDFWISWNNRTLKGKQEWYNDPENPQNKTDLRNKLNDKDYGIATQQLADAGDPEKNKVQDALLDSKKYLQTQLVQLKIFPTLKNLKGDGASRYLYIEERIDTALREAAFKQQKAVLDSSEQRALINKELAHAVWDYEGSNTKRLSIELSPEQRRTLEAIEIDFEDVPAKFLEEIPKTDNRGNHFTETQIIKAYIAKEFLEDEDLYQQIVNGEVNLE